MALATGNVRNVPPELEQLKAQLGLPDEFDLQSCGKQSCWLLNNLIPINDIISRVGVHLNERPRGELTLTWRPTDCPWLVAVAVVLFLIKWHSCIVHFEHFIVGATPLLEVITVLQDRTDIVSFSVTYPEIDCGDIENTDDEDTNDEAKTRLGPLLVKFVDNSANLTTFRLHGEHIRDEEQKGMGEALAKKVALEEISLECEGIMDYFVNCFMEKGTTTSLRKFTCVYGCLCVEKVAKLIELSPKLSCLKLDSVSLYNVGECSAQDSTFEEVAKALWNNKSVKTLSLKGRIFTSDALIPLAEMLLHNEMLTTLDITFSSITCEAGDHMARSLKTTATLKNLVLKNCDMPPSTTRNIIAALKENPQGPVVSFRGLIPSNILQVCVEEKTDKVEFACTNEVLKLTGIPDWYNVTDISISTKVLTEARMKSVCTYLGQGSSRVKRCEFFKARESDCVQLAAVLQNNAVVEELTLEMRRMSTEALQALARVVEKNMHLRRLSVELRYQSYYANFAEAMLFAKALERNRTLEVFKCEFVFDANMVLLFSKSLVLNYALTQFTFYLEHSGQTVIRRHPVAHRNKVLQQQALHLVLEECPQRRWATAFSLTHHTPSLRRKLQETTEMSGEEVERLIRKKLRYIRENFFRITGIVKERVICNAAPPGVVQIDRLGSHLLMHIVSFLKVIDVK